MVVDIWLVVDAGRNVKDVDEASRQSGTPISQDDIYTCNVDVVVNVRSVRMVGSVEAVVVVLMVEITEPLVLAVGNGSMVGGGCVGAPENDGSG